MRTIWITIIVFAIIASCGCLYADDSSAQVGAGDIAILKPDNISGHYVRETENEKAELTVNLLPNGLVQINGISRWRSVDKSRYLPKIERLRFEAPFKNGHVIFTKSFNDKTWNIKDYKIDLTFRQNGIAAKEQNALDYFGTHVNFAGEYSIKKAANQPSTEPKIISRERQAKVVAEKRELLEQIKINDKYTFRKYKGSEWGEDYEILNNDKVVHTAGDSRCSVSAGDLEGVRVLPPVGANITGDGIPNLVVGCSSGGSHCCIDITIYSLGESLKVIKNFNFGYSKFELIDLDGDGIYELRIADWTFQGWGGVWMYGAAEGIANQDVILRYKNGDYQIAPDLMKRFPSKIKLPSLETIKKEFNETHSDNPVSFEMWRYMLALIYQGRGDEAFEFCDKVWPKDRKYKEKFIVAFKMQLTKSPYWSGIKELNGW